MFAAIFDGHYGFLAALTFVGLAMGGLAWWTATRKGNPHGLWWLALTATVTGVIGVTSFGGGQASRQCVINHDLAEPFHTAQGLLNLAMFVPVGCFALLALRRPVPAFLGTAVLPCLIELSQATVPFVARGCDSADVEMNLLGGLIGLLTAGAFLARQRRLDWSGWAKPAAVAGLAVAIAGTVVFRTLVSSVHYDGTGLSAPGEDQHEAVTQAVQRAFGDRFPVTNVYVQPCLDVQCTNLIFNVGGDGTGTLEWPDQRHLNILLEASSEPGANSFPVATATAPQDKDDAYRTAETYMRGHYSWAAGATLHRTEPVGEDAEFGWITSWRFMDNDILMPRMLDVQVNRAGRISQIDVTMGPTELDLPDPKISKGQAEQLVLGHLREEAEASGNPPSDVTVDAFTLKANDRGHGWRPEWIVNSRPPHEEGTESVTTTNWVDALDGTVHISAYPPL
ncbi:VanZ family protein [Streptomyces sp. AC558_RSS880]|uniref:VanZ family protein n=1 Tax=Streptomyces sp. AC558_RSS880 TaxID=2823687 RepID=UPI001C242D10|nr:VanZ family protein [Streptomyces sp. AC558_RSS880]